MWVYEREDTTLQYITKGKTQSASDQAMLQKHAHKEDSNSTP